jgi:glucosamine--fructose-6-phosphate aminotransferase (isomerizing)
LPHTQRLVFLEHGDTAEVRADRVAYRHNGLAITREPEDVPLDPLSAAKGSYKHFMQKEIAEQPEGLLDTIRGRALFGELRVELDDVAIAAERLRQIERVLLVGMGTSLHSAMVGRTYMEQIAGIPGEVDNASELRYRNPLIGPETLMISVTQSGETVDTLAAMEEARQKGCLQIAITNVPGSQASRVADGAVYTRCGLEVGVASTKTYTAAITALYLLSLFLAQERDGLRGERMGGYLEPLSRLPNLAGEMLKREPEIEKLARRLQNGRNFLVLGRGIQYPVALEGALKLKELSYIHAEGYPSGEMKHGPIALIDREMPVFALCPRDNLRDKMMNNIEQVKARDGIVVAVASEGDTEVADKADHVLYVPELSPLLLPVLTSIPMQQFAYHVAVLRGNDVDQPRNLAKTVTVE